MIMRRRRGACRVRDDESCSILSVASSSRLFEYSVALLLLTTAVNNCDAFTVKKHLFQHPLVQTTKANTFKKAPDRTSRSHVLFYRMWPLWLDLMEASPTRKRDGANRKVEFVNSSIYNNPISHTVEEEEQDENDGNIFYEDFKLNSSLGGYSINNEVSSDASLLANSVNSTSAAELEAGQQNLTVTNASSTTATSSMNQPSFAESLLSAANSLSASFAPPMLSQSSRNASDYQSKTSGSTVAAAATKSAVVSWFDINANSVDKSKKLKVHDLARKIKKDSKSTASATISLGDLESYLEANGYVRQADLVHTDSESPKNASSSSADMMKNMSLSAVSLKTNSNEKKTPALPSSGKSKSSGSSSSEFSTPRKQTGSVAFPQPSVLSYKSVRRGSTVAAGLMGIIVGFTIHPNLWLMGGILMAAYGYDITKHLGDDSDKEPPTNVVAKAIIKVGRNLAKRFLWYYDFVKGLWFMYKTGQLSYEYWKQYAALDERFAIQNKIDAWNARFQEGKIAFDEWEKENEIGRKVLATLRTVWLVEEQSLKKNRKKLLKSSKTSRYRFLQYYYDTKYWVTRQLRQFFQTIAGVLGGWSNKGVKEFMQGLRMNGGSSRGGELGKRVGAVGAALVFVYITGALFAISPLSLTIVSVLLGIIWPSWFGELLNRFTAYFEETRARGRGEDSLLDDDDDDDFLSNFFNDQDDDDVDNDFVFSSKSKKQMKRRADRVLVAVSSPFQRLRYANVEKDNFHYYIRQDGSKRYYRTGQPIFTTVMTQMAKKQKKKEKKAYDDLVGMFGFNNNKNAGSNNNKKAEQGNNGFDLFGIFGDGGSNGSGNNRNNNNVKPNSYAFSWPWE